MKRTFIQVDTKYANTCAVLTIKWWTCMSDLICCRIKPVQRQMVNKDDRPASPSYAEGVYYTPFLYTNNTLQYS